MNCLVIGGTGAVGQRLLQQLDENENVENVLSIQRRQLSKTYNKVEQRIIDLNNLDEAPIENKIDACFCCLGTTIKKAKTKENFRKIDLEMVVDFAKLANRLQCQKLLVVSAMGVAKNSFFFYNRVKAEMEEKVAIIPIKSISFFRPSLITKRGDFRFGEWLGELFMLLLKPFTWGPFKKYDAISTHRIARAMVKVSQREVVGLRIFNSGEIWMLSRK